MPLIPKEWLSNVKMRRIIIHWTAGAYKANSIDRAAYHILIEGDGDIVRGTHSIADNVTTADGKYAAHTLGSNTGCISISMCCMGGCVERPFKAGRWPLTPVQWETAAKVAAELSPFYEIPVTNTTILGHGEVQKNLGITQRGKWDPMVLPWNTSLSYAEVGDTFRGLVRAALAGETEEPPAAVRVKISTVEFATPEAIMEDGATFVAISPLAEALGWKVISAARGEAVIGLPGKDTITVPYMVEKLRGENKGFVSCRELAEALEMGIAWDAEKRLVTLS